MTNSEDDILKRHTWPIIATLQPSSTILAGPHSPTKKANPPPQQRRQRNSAALIPGMHRGGQAVLGEEEKLPRSRGPKNDRKITSSIKSTKACAVEVVRYAFGLCGDSLHVLHPRLELHVPDV